MFSNNKLFTLRNQIYFLLYPKIYLISELDYNIFPNELVFPDTFIIIILVLILSS